MIELKKKYELVCRDAAHGVCLATPGGRIQPSVLFGHDVLKDIDHDMTLYAGDEVEVTVKVLSRVRTIREPV